MHPAAPNRFNHCVDYDNAEAVNRLENLDASLAIHRMQNFDAKEIERNSFVKQVIVLPEVDSTSTYAKQWIASERVRLPALVIAERQTAGRGQQNKHWWSGSGSLTFTLVRNQPQEIENGLLSIAVGIAVSESVSTMESSLTPKIKWPNDLILNGKKLAGILIERIGGMVETIGVGVNTNCDFQDANPDIANIATSILETSGRPVHQQSYLLKLLEAINSWIHDHSSKGIIDTFMSISQFKKGETIFVKSSRFGTLQGQFNGIGSRGELILSVDGDNFRVESGSIVSTS